MNYTGNFRKAAFGGFHKDDVFAFFEELSLEHKKELEELQSQLENQKAMTLSAQEQLTAALLQNEELQTDRQAADLSLAEKAAELEKLRSDIKSLRAYNSEVTMKKSVAENTINKLQLEKADLDKKLSDCIAALQQAAEYRANTQQELEELRSAKIELETSNVILTSEKALLEAEREELLAARSAKTPVEKLGEEISNIVVEAKGLADRIVNKAYTKADDAKHSIHTEQKDVKDTVHAAGEKLRGIASSYKTIAEDFYRQIEELCSRVDDAETHLDVNDYFAEDEDAVDVEVTSVAPKAPVEDYSEKIKEALKQDN